jgi:lysozyme
LNLDAGISRDEAALLLRHRLEVVGDALSLYLPWWGRLDEVRRAVLVVMAYNLGVAGLLKFHRTLAAVEAGDYEAAARGMLGSRWAQQTPARARRTAEAMRTGRWPEEL